MSKYSQETLVKFCSDNSITLTLDYSSEPLNASTKIEVENLKEGDLVFFNTVSASMVITHVGMFVCNNKFVHASTSKGVTISDLSEKYFAKAFRGAGRFINP